MIHRKETYVTTRLLTELVLSTITKNDKCIVTSNSPTYLSSVGGRNK